MSWRIGIDIGGTFTDVAVVNEDNGHIGVVKVPSTPRDFAQAVIDALAASTKGFGISPGQVAFISHATTVVTNALLEARGARTALVTTRGFRDILEIRRQNRADLYDMFQDAPTVLAPRHLRLEVTERLNSQGEVVVPLNQAELDGVVRFLKQHQVEAVAVCLLYSFLNPRHEQTIGQALRDGLPGIPVFLSSEVLPEVREYERTSTTAVCAYAGPLLARYLERLQAELKEAGYPPLYLMGSGGGVFTVPEGLKVPAMVVESGPAAGVVAAAMVGRLLGHDSLISFDMGGTTAKASLIEGGEAQVTTEYEVGGQGNLRRWTHGTGHPIKLPVVDLAEVSAGGGSIAWIDPGGALRVGPHSAGAEPGPVCYGQGGQEPTVTDADLVLGYLNPEHLLGGELPVYLDRAREAIQEKIARPLGLTVLEAARGIVEVVNASMAEALRIVSVERGYDPREFTLVAFGGAGPVHAAHLAAELEVPQVVVPLIPGGFSALGLVATDLKRDYVQTFYAPLRDADLPALNHAYAAMEATAAQMLTRAQVPRDRWSLARSTDLRYFRQAYELNVPVPSGDVTQQALEGVAQAFHEKHQMTYGYSAPQESVQLVNLRLTAIGKLPGLGLSQQELHMADPNPALAGTRPVSFSETAQGPCPIYSRDRLLPGAHVTGPAIIEAMDTTIVVPPGTAATVDTFGFILIEVQRDA